MLPYEMKAVTYTDFNAPLSIRYDVPVPEISDDGVLIAVKATGVCRSDHHGWKGHDSDVKTFLTNSKSKYFIPGHEVAGVVVKVGLDVKNFKLNDRVVVPFILSCGSCRYCACDRATICERQEQPGFTQFGSFAEYLAVPRADRNLCFLPENVSFIEAAALGCRFTTAYRAVIQQGKVSCNDSVAVFGSGGLGLSCIMIAASANASMIVAIDISYPTLKKAKSLGATHTINASRGQHFVRKKLEELCPGGAKICIDAAGFHSTCEDAVYCTASGGKMIQVGLPLGKPEPLIPMARVAGKELEIIGSHGIAASDLPKVLALVSEGKLCPGNIVEREVSLEEGAKCLEDMDRLSPLGVTMITSFDEQSRM